MDRPDLQWNSLKLRMDWFGPRVLNICKGTLKFAWEGPCKLTEAVQLSGKPAGYLIDPSIV